MDSLLKLTQNSNDFKTLVRAFQKAGLTQLLQTNGPYTLFAPNDNAFMKYPADKLQILLNDKTRLTSILKSHLVQKKITSTDLQKTKKIRTLTGKEMMISKNGMEIENAKIITTDIHCSNGIIHKIDSVLLLK